jgi:hypothetical protein
VPPTVAATGSVPAAAGSATGSSAPAGCTAYTALNATPARCTMNTCPPLASAVKSVGAWALIACATDVAISVSVCTRNPPGAALSLTWVTA